MQNCAYCDTISRPTREHVIPDWYNKTPGETETFSARAPLTQVKGDLLVKDVCSGCNNGVLSSLDEYGRELYDRYFATPVYAGESVTFEYDGDRLFRWLLKLSYNSARAQNADVLILREYRKIILGETPISDHLRCWVHLTTASYIDPDAKIIRAARADERGHSNIDEPLWFRIAQFRMRSHPALTLAQRLVLINSFSFTLVISRPNDQSPNQEFENWIRVYTSANPNAVAIQTGTKSATLAATYNDHTATSLYPHMLHYASRYGSETNPVVVEALKGDAKPALLFVPRDSIEAGDISPFSEVLQDMVSTREKASAFRQRVGIWVHGYDEDPRGLWLIPEARQFFCRLFSECPFVMLLADPNADLLKVFAACWVHEDGMTEDIQRKRMHEFMTLGFQGLNEITHALAWSEEANREICDAATKTLLIGPQAHAPSRS